MDTTLPRLPPQIGATPSRRWILSGTMLCVAATSGFVMWRWISAGPQPAILGGGVPMAPSTAVMLLLFALVIGAQPWVSAATFRFAVLTVASLAVFAGLSVFVRDSGLAALPWEQWYLRTEALAVRDFVIGQMSILTGVLMLLLGLAATTLVAPLAGHPKLCQIAFAVVALCTLFSGGIAVSYLAGVPLFYGARIVPMAFSTATTSALIGGTLLLLLDRRRAGSSNVQQKITVGLCVIVALFVFLAGMAYLGLNGIRDSQRTIVTQNLANVFDLVQLRSNLNAERLDVATMLNLPSTAWESWQSDMDQRTVDDADILQRLAQRFADDAAERKTLQQLHVVWEEFLAVRRTKVLALLRGGDVAAARDLFVGRQMQRHAQIRALVGSLEATEKLEAEQQVVLADRRSRLFTTLFVGASGASVLGAIGLGLMMRRTLETYVRERDSAEKSHRQASAYNRSLLEASLDPLVAIGTNGKITDVNASVEAVTGYARSVLVGTDFSDYFTEPEKARAGYLQVFREGLVRDYPLQVRHRDGRITPVLYNASVYRNAAGAVAGVFAEARDITQMKRSEAELRRINRALRATTACNQVIIHASDEGALLHEVCRVIVEDAGYRMAWIGFAENDAGKTVRPVAIAGYDEGYVAAAQITWAETERGRGPSGRAIRTGQPAICQDMLSDPSFAPWREPARAHGFASSIVLPLRHETQTFGVLSIYAGEREAFDEKEASWLRELGEDLAFGLAGFRVRAERKRAQDALVRSEHRLSEAQRMAHLGSWDLEIATSEVRWSEETFRIYSWPRREGAFPLSQSMQVNFAEDQSAVDQAFSATLADGRPLEIEYRIRRPDGTVRWVRCLGEVMRDDTGRPEHIAGTVLDITEPRQAQEAIADLNRGLEQRVRERTAELETVNHELESFAYSVSHDLRAPLRSIDGFSRILLRDSAGALGDRGCENLERIRAATQRMGQLIDDLLKLSRMARADFNRKPVDLAQVAQAIAADLTASDPQRHVVWRIGSHLSVAADPILIRAALENLLGNAWKFTSRTTAPVIEFTTMTHDGERVFVVRDNGAGFDMKYVGKLFGAFQRLHATEEFPGTGIGLAAVQRVIHRHGGRVWAEGKVGHGAKFYFTISNNSSRS